MANVSIKKMKRAEEDYRSLLVRYKKTKCEVETLNGELTEAYSKIKSLALKTINERVEVHDSLDEDEVKKDAAHLMKNF